jgi:predicted alpha/beta hydrolase family esterase
VSVLLALGLAALTLPPLLRAARGLVQGGLLPALVLLDLALAGAWLSLCLVLVHYERVNAPDGFDPQATSPGDRAAGMLLEWAVAALTPLLIPGYRLPTLVLGRRTGKRRPVMLVHGYSRNALDFLLLARDLLRNGYGPVALIRLSPLRGSIESFSRHLAAELNRLHSPEDEPWILICHSMGGIVARLALHEELIQAPVARVITLGTPHQGTKVAAFAAGVCGAQLRPGSLLLKMLNQDPRELSRARFTAVRSSSDQIVLPPRSARLPEPAENILLHGIGHNCLMYAPRARQAVLQALRTEGS